jgi:hypothetical protein
LEQAYSLAVGLAASPLHQHAGFVQVGHVDDGGIQSGGLAVHLHGDRLGRCDASGLALRDRGPVAASLQQWLKLSTNKFEPNVKNLYLLAARTILF